MDDRTPHLRRLLIVLGITAAALVVEAIVALSSGSLALLADAVDLVVDMGGLLLAIAALTLARRSAARHGAGLQKVEVVSAGINCLALLVLSAWIISRAVGRLDDPPEIEAPWVLVAAVFGFAANLVCMLILRESAKESINVRGAYLEVMGDTLGSVAVISSSVVILATGAYIADPIASLVIAVMIIARSLALLRDVVREWKHLLMR